MILTCDGDDHVNSHSGGSDGGVDIVAIIPGGAGNDHLDGGAGNDVLVGGDGKDKLFGRGRNDILIGGDGRHDLKGGDGDDLLIGGSAAAENDLASLDAAFDDWADGDLNGALDQLSAITDDGVKDDLKGEHGNDHLIGGVGDKLKP